VGGFEDVINHPWFRSIPWNLLDRKEFEPPFVPDSKKANFDATFELEELLLEDNPLKARKRNPNQDINNLSTEMRQLEEQFTNYDHDKMKRRSYYPSNQHIVSTITATSSTANGQTSRPASPDRPLDPHTLSVNVPPLPRIPTEKDIM